MADKEAVLASLNINAMTFNKHDSVPVDFGASGSSLRAGEVRDFFLAFLKLSYLKETRKAQSICPLESCMTW